ncbi:MAG: hypothetical protein ACI4CY_02965 [Candidatus Gastranaerophilaceae bacterium]
MRKHRNTKAENQTYHFKKRCEERLGVQVDRKSVQRRIRNREFDENFYLLNKQSNRVTRYRYKFQNVWYIIPYDKNTHKVVTIFEDKFQDIVNEAPQIPDKQIPTNIFAALFVKIITELQKFLRFCSTYRLPLIR